MIISAIPSKARTAIYPFQQFVAPAVVGGNSFRFPSGVANYKLLTTLQRGSVYLFDRISWAANVSEVDWVGAAANPVLNLYASTVQPGQLSGAGSSNFKKILSTGYPLVTFASDSPFDNFYSAEAQDVNIYAEIVGDIVQTDNIIPMSNIRVQLKFDMYRVDAVEYQTVFRDGVKTPTNRGML